jgi:SAM-dependent methyltransferase
MYSCVHDGLSLHACPVRWPRSCTDPAYLGCPTRRPETARLPSVRCLSAPHSDDEPIVLLRVNLERAKVSRRTPRRVSPVPLPAGGCVPRALSPRSPTQLPRLLSSRTLAAGQGSMSASRPMAVCFRLGSLVPATSRPVSRRFQKPSAALSVVGRQGLARTISSGTASLRRPCGTVASKRRNILRCPNLTSCTFKHTLHSADIMPSASFAGEALTGFAKGALYEQHRPSYTDQAVGTLLRALGVEGVANAEVLDLAAGTGKFTDLLAQRKEDYHVVAVEPHVDMRKELERKSWPNVAVKAGLSTRIPLEDESVDGVIAAQVRPSQPPPFLFTSTLMQRLFSFCPAFLLKISGKALQVELDEIGSSRCVSHVDKSRAPEVARAQRRTCLAFGSTAKTIFQLLERRRNGAANILYDSLAIPGRLFVDIGEFQTLSPYPLQKVAFRTLSYFVDVCLHARDATDRL